MTYENVNSSPSEKDEVLIDLAETLSNEYAKTDGNADTFGIWCIPGEGMLQETCIQFSGGSFSPWDYRNPQISKLVRSLWNLTERSWSCLILVIFANTGEFKAEFLSESELDRDLEEYYDFPGQARQFLEVANDTFQHLS